MSKFQIVFLSLFLPLFALAQDTTTHLLDEVLITANKYPKKQTETGKVVTVINSRTLQQMGSRTLPEVINTIAGVSINGANNNRGTNQGVSIRGASFGNALILIDGIPVNDPSVISNYFDLNLIPVDGVERIEIVKGGQSTLYGSDAVSGVINIITKKGVNKPLGLQAQFTGGSYHTYETTLGLSGKINRLSYNLQHNHTKSDGFSAAYDSTGNRSFDKDNYKQKTVRGEVGYALTSNLQLKLFGSYSRYKAGVDAGAFLDDKDYTTTSKNVQGGTGLRWKMKGGDLVANYHYNNLERDYLNDSSDRSNPSFYYENSKYIGRTHYAEVYKSFKINNWELLTGADLRSNNSDQRYSYTYLDYFTQRAAKGETILQDSLAHTLQISPYASAVYQYQNLSVEIGGRYNHHSTYGSNLTYTFNPSYLIKEKVRIFFNASSAFKAPSLYQLYDDFAGNKDLAPEKSATIEGGIALYATTHFSSRITLFNRKTKNAIQYIITDPATYTSQYRNVSHHTNSGLEAELTYQTAKWNASANYTFTKGKLISPFSETGNRLKNDTTINNLYRVPKHMANLFAFYNINPKFSIGTVLKFSGKRLEPVYASRPNVLDDYYTIDLSTAYRFNNILRLFADFKNITNQKYFDISGYNSRRFNFNAGVSFSL
ncbi:MAG: TonB-dependent receptor [Chitinophagaceae bacterium]